VLFNESNVILQKCENSVRVDAVETRVEVVGEPPEGRDGERIIRVVIVRDSEFQQWSL
jgi:hypothetical protein